jgi:hypothetical protein
MLADVTAIEGFLVPGGELRAGDVTNAMNATTVTNRPTVSRRIIPATSFGGSALRTKSK